MQLILTTHNQYALHYRQESQPTVFIYIYFFYIFYLVRKTLRNNINIIIFILFGTILKPM